MKVPEESLKRLSGNMLELCKLPLNDARGPVGLDAYSSEFQKLVAGMPIALSGNGFSEEVEALRESVLGKRFESSSACVNWMKSLLHGQKLTSDRKEAERRSKGTAWRRPSRSSRNPSPAGWIRSEAGSGLVKHGLLKEVSTAQPIQ